jgi:hypothetical protein
MQTGRSRTGLDRPLAADPVAGLARVRADAISDAVSVGGLVGNTVVWVRQERAAPVR